PTPQVGQLPWSVCAGMTPVKPSLPEEAATADLLITFTGCSTKCSLVSFCSIIPPPFFRFVGTLYFRWLLEKTIHRFSAAARRVHPPQGLIPTAYVAFLIASPRPISSSEMNPGSRTR